MCVSVFLKAQSFCYCLQVLSYMAINLNFSDQHTSGSPLNLSTNLHKFSCEIFLHHSNQMVLHAQNNLWTSGWTLIFMSASDTCLNHREICFPSSAALQISSFMTNKNTLGYKKRVRTFKLSCRWIRAV